MSTAAGTDQRQELAGRFRKIAAAAWREQMHATGSHEREALGYAAMMDACQVRVGLLGDSPAELAELLVLWRDNAARELAEAGFDVLACRGRVEHQDNWRIHGHLTAASAALEIIRPQVRPCVICGKLTTNTQQATIGDRSGVACVDCAYWCDGNLGG